MINNVVLIGRLTKDIELKSTQNGIAVTSFTLAVNRPFKNQQGENEADFINCVAWRKQAENAAKFLGKGSLIGVEGRIETRNYEGQDGKRVYVTEVVADRIQFIETKGNNSAQESTPAQNFNQQAQGFAGMAQNFKQAQGDPFAKPQNDEKVNVTDDQLPF